MNQIESNKLIAEFMGFEQYEIKGKSNGYKVVLKQGFVPAETCAASLQFHTSWDWLMPVVEKINSDIHYNESKEYRHLMSLKITTNIKVLYKAIVEFIKWYSQQNQ